MKNRCRNARFVLALTRTWHGRPLLTMAFRKMEKGTFRMGQLGIAEPVHEVSISAFWMAETPVTQAQFAVWKEGHKNRFPDRPDHPAERMDWDDASGYCAWLTDRFRRQFPRGMAAAELPTEARWEYACRAGTDTDYWRGTGGGALEAVGWYGKNSEGGTKPVAEKDANPWGLYDMHGNVDEWCQDAWDSAAYAKRADGVADPVTEIHEDPEIPPRVVRGGSWSFAAGWCRSAYRVGGHPSYRGRDLGFRVCLVPGPAKSNPP